ncbi:MAG: DUF4012 domain-containing protein [Candidatus Buchananbacteria bacterium]|nr:DUF4012 domain-containing protein [Candidatus Buchananbacteria bacterium]
MPKAKTKKTTRQKTTTRKKPTNKAATKKSPPKSTPKKKNNAAKSSKKKSSKQAKKTAATITRKKVVKQKKSPAKKSPVKKKINKQTGESLLTSKKIKSKRNTNAINKSSEENKNTKKSSETVSNPKLQQIPKQNNFIKKQKTPISPYVLDLKSIQAEQAKEKQLENQQAQNISQELLTKLNKQKNKIYDRFQADTEKNPKFKKKVTLPKLQIKLPKISLPKFTLPKLSRPKINLPKINLPQFNLPKLKPLEIKIGSISIPPYWQKTILAFIVFCLIFILPFNLYGYYQKLQGKKNTVLQQTAQAIWHLTISQKAAAAKDFYYTQFELQEASNDFQAAKNELGGINLLTKNAIKLFPSINKQFITAQKLISVGETLSKSAAMVTATIESIEINGELDSLNLTAKLKKLNDDFNLILPDLKNANNELQEIHINELPLEYQSKVKKLQQALPLLVKNIDNFVSSSDLLLTLLGEDTKKRYLFLFQNNNELRPTGGFIGSFALVDIDQGNIQKINIPGGGPYDLRAGLKVNMESPKPLHIMNPRWEFQDANWFADLPTSADKLIWFYEKSGGPTVDGLVFINATFLEKILKIIGPIELPNYNKTITADNFFQEIQTNVELEYDKSINKPKKIIADLTPIIIDNLLSSDQKQFSEILNIFLNALNEKEIQLYFTNYSLEKLVLQNNWGGQLKQTTKDYLNIISTNIAGEKTDAKIEQTANLTVEIQPEGSIINTLQITKTHTGKAGENFYGVPNVDYLRIYTPKDSELISASGFDRMEPELFEILNQGIYQKDDMIAFTEMTKKIDEQSQTEIFTENNKTVFANWLKINPGQTKTVTLKYKLPFKLDLEATNENLNYWDLLKNELNLNGETDHLKDYNLLWQKQSGKNFMINLTIDFPKNLNYQMIYPDKLNQTNNTFNYHDLLNTDKFFVTTFSLK